VFKLWLTWSGGWRAWSGALAVLIITVLVVTLDLSVASVHRFWSQHSITSSVLSGLLVLLLTGEVRGRSISPLRFGGLRGNAVAPRHDARLTRAGRPLVSISGAAVKVLVRAFALLGVLEDS
jgi:hypothetical protein